MGNPLILVILLLLIIELLATRHTKRLSFWLGVICLILWLAAVFGLGSGLLR